MFGSGTIRCHLRLGSYSVNCVLFTSMLLSHSISVPPQIIIVPSFGSPQQRDYCMDARAHTHTHIPTQILLLFIQLPGFSRLRGSFIPFPYSTFWCVACTVLPHELTRLSVMRVSWAANYSTDVSVIRIIQPTRRLSFTELKAMQSLLKDLAWTGAVTFQPYF